MSSDAPETGSKSGLDRAAPGDSSPLDSVRKSASSDDLDVALMVGQPDPALDPLKLSSDDLTRLITDVQPDPLLSSWKDEISRSPNRGPQPVVDHPGCDPEAPTVVVETHGLNFQVEHHTDSDLFSEIQIGQKGNPKPSKGSDEISVLDEDGSDEEEAPARNSSLLVILLASYASAVTLGLLWVLVSGRKLEPASKAFDSVSDAEGAGTADPGVRADRSRKVMEPPLIPKSNMTRLGQSLRLGDVEITPFKLTAGPVTLERTLTVRQVKKAGERALNLRVRIRNVSESAVLAPLDEGFLRQRLRADPESFIQSTTGQAAIQLYPLAVTSEWSIVGQEIKELRPGSSFESVIVSEPEALERVEPEMVWRIRMRIGINQTADLGVTFRSEDVKIDATQPDLLTPKP